MLNPLGIINTIRNFFSTAFSMPPPPPPPPKVAITKKKKEGGGNA